MSMTDPKFARGGSKYKTSSAGQPFVFPFKLCIKLPRPSVRAPFLNNHFYRSARGLCRVVHCQGQAMRCGPGVKQLELCLATH